MIIWTVLLIFVPLLILEAFFSSSEIALVAANRRRLQHLADKGQRRAALALKLLSKPERLFATTLVGANLAEICNTVLVTALLIEYLGWKGEIVAMLALPPLVLLLAEITPKSIARQRPNRLARHLSPILWIVSWLIYPITMIFAALSRFVLVLTGAPQTSQVPFVTREELQMVVKVSRPEVALKGEERAIIHRILHFSQTTVKEVMVPLIEVAAIPETFLVSQALAELQRTHFSRLPVYRQRIDNIIGVLHSFDLLGEEPSSRAIKPLVRGVEYVPEIKRVDYLLGEMQRMGLHLAVVVDEYGGAVGIVTIEDLLEEIVGEIADEFDQEMPPFQKLWEGIYLVNARMEIQALNEALGLELPLGNYETLGGFLIHQLGDIPRSGDRLQFQNLTFIIRSATVRAIKEVEIHVRPTTAP
ncbi:MAG: hemolysin family protein [Desulfobacteraceae bacterium]